ncbi:MAG TPA: single-stranded DNA-binding protein [Bacillota bacterium]|nr:single-stranded DNA-binding protein [Bacillota bacterium]HOK69965.1 single-stranded DNA-binding protein [Bacillota bacterium]HPQ01839.1 single-stranded DNA-binding protein [Bacillota bacterium]HPZ13794.1 single-stranded DNA-binding protein [Bacillota bacterium]HQD80448.1 single-stranded DNA-binding protein [Bacillota bacterium]
MMNRVVIVGRLTHDPELRFTQNGIAVTRFSLAVDRPFTNQQGERETDFLDVVVWRRQAENVAAYLKKGSLAAVDGRVQVRSYETPEGQKRKVWEIVADRVEFLDRRGDTGSQMSQGGYGRTQPELGEDEDDVPMPEEAETFGDQIDPDIRL